ncbi:hypothetical protein O3P69_012062 [Scylla paramamosain]|uniref:Uncharacterized protein n=1 Tax=Scylla paramamosain TaxID=85552 RepID=A0AAW0SD53_SCYPA
MPPGSARDKPPLFTFHFIITTSAPSPPQCPPLLLSSPANTHLSTPTLTPSSQYSPSSFLSAHGLVCFPTLVKRQVFSVRLAASLAAQLQHRQHGQRFSLWNVRGLLVKGQPPRPHVNVTGPDLSARPGGGVPWSALHAGTRASKFQQRIRYVVNNMIAGEEWREAQCSPITMK